MKKIICILIFAFPFQLFSTVKFFDSVNGNDANTGLSWEQAWQNLHIKVSTMANGDTAACVGLTFLDFYPTKQVTFMDSLTYTNGWTLEYPDTLNMWSAGFNSSYLYSVNMASGIDNTTWIGFWFRGSTQNIVAIPAGGANNHKFYHCKFSNAYDASTDIVSMSETSSGIEFHYCLFISEGDISTGIQNSGSIDVVINHCTFSGNFTSVPLSSVLNRSFIVTNCIIENTSTASGDWIRWHGGSIFSGGDYNVYNGTVQMNSKYVFEIATPLFATWVDSCNNYGATYESHSIEDDPLLRNKYETAWISGSSPAWGICTDGSNAGYFQVTKKSQIIFIR